MSKVKIHMARCLRYFTHVSKKGDGEDTQQEQKHEQFFASNFAKKTISGLTPPLFITVKSFENQHFCI